jgi:hypothetical protein
VLCGPMRDGARTCHVLVQVVPSLESGELGSKMILSMATLLVSD